MNLGKDDSKGEEHEEEINYRILETRPCGRKMKKEVNDFYLRMQ